MKKNIVFIVAFVAFVLTVGTSEAQPPSPGGYGHGGPPSTGGVPPEQPSPPFGEEGKPLPPGGLEPIPPMEGILPAHEVLEQIMLARIAEQLNLNDEQTILLIRKFNEQKKLFNEKNKQRNEIINDIKKLLQGKADENAQVLEEKFNLLIKTDTEITELKYKWVDNLAMDLPLNSKIQLYLFFSDFENEIRKFLRKTYEWKQNRHPNEKTGLIPPDQRRGKSQKPINDPNTGNE
ncbi:MAG TPA: hypothetical protein PLX23_12970 [Candidatus Hydrogenedens sp.]|nr:hypothetical protein [Candidatus Hydrogenedens sp.]